MLCWQGMLLVLSGASGTVPWFYLCPIISPAVASFWMLCWGPNSMSQNPPTWKWLTHESLWPGHEPGGMKGVYCELDEKYINKGVPHCSTDHITITPKTIYTDLEPRVQLSLIQRELHTKTKGSLIFSCPPLISGFWYFFGLSEKDPKEHINNGRSHMMKILLTHPQGSVVLSLRENYSGAKDNSTITHLLFLVRRSINIASTWRRSSCLLRGAKVPCPMRAHLY